MAILLGAKLFLTPKKSKNEVYWFISSAANEPIYFIFGLFQLLYRVCYLTKAQSVETLHLSKFLSRISCPHHGNFGVWGMYGVGYTL